MNSIIEDVLKKQIKENISKQVDEIIENKVKEFHRELVNRKDDYISEIMKGIRYFHEQDPMTLSMNYKITFENIYRVGDNNAR